MLRIRLAEEKLVEPILDGTVRCPVHLYSGEEAVASGIGANLANEDYVFGNHRSHGHYLAKGGDLKKMIAEIYCKESGCCGGRGGSMHLVAPEKGILGIAPIVAGTISLALGAALASSIRKDGRVAVTFFGDGATGEGVLYEAMNFASIKKLPIIFACENNLYSTHLPIKEIRVDCPIVEVAKPFGISSYQVDGNDVLAVYEASQEAVKKCRSGNGPVFMEFLTYRFRGHVGPDDNIQGTHTDIRPKEELQQWLEKDPIIRFEKYLKDNSIIDSATMNKIRKNISDEVNDAVRYAVESNRPNKEEVTKYVFRKEA
ncbi:MAG: thiamine pyrophosphate-dependent dehydrogenase E1 component subunit alpha [Bacteroidota bacterium]